MGAKRYKYWSRLEFFELMVEQAVEHGINVDKLHRICFSDQWDPKIDFNGCNFVQDNYHPFIPCFFHDFERKINAPALQTDKNFKSDLLKLGFTTFLATFYYFGVRVGWFFTFKWIKKWL